MNTVQSLINGFFEARCPEGLKASVRAEMLTLTVEQMKQEVLEDIERNLLSAKVKSFSDLHDHVDANEYGGFCDDELSDLFIQFFGGRDQHEGMPDAYLDFMNEAQNAVDAWLAAGRPS